MKFVVLLVVVWLGGALCKVTIYQNENGLGECGKCDPQACERVTGCVAGMVKDRCGCCDVCGKAEYELCYHRDVSAKDGIFLGRCGDNLQCQVRQDLDQDAPDEAICYCSVEGTLCGSDDKTYNNLCALSASSAEKGEKIIVKDYGPCNEGPQILAPPEHVKDELGESVALVCEARGFPIPTVEWTWTRVDGKTIYLPSDDTSVSVNMRGGPEKWQVTGWLQIMDLQKVHEGDYTCVAQNKHGMAQSTARINVALEKDAGKKTRSRY